VSPRYELPPGLTPEEERAVVAALEQALRPTRPELSGWALAGRAENLRSGALELRRDAHSAWTFRADVPFTRRVVPNLRGRGDAR